MDFGLSPEQQLLDATLRRFLEEEVPLARVREIAASEAGFDAAVWRGLAELGVAGALVPEEHGGSGLALLDAAVAAEALGAFATPAPFLSAAVMAVVALRRAGSPEQQKHWLPRLASGEAVLSVAANERFSRREGAGVRADGDQLRGKALFALDAAGAETFLVACQDDRLALVPRGAGGLTVSPLPTVDGTRRVAELVLDGVSAEWLPGPGGPALDAALDAGRVILAADLLGAGQRALELAVAYAGERRQFGRVIGSFQAVKHLCAEMAAELEPARSLLWYAAHAFDAAPEEAAEMAAHAKAHLAEVGRFVARTATEVHGGIGFTDECDVQLFFKRIALDRQLLGTPEQLRERAAALQGWVAA